MKLRLLAILLLVVISTDSCKKSTDKTPSEPETFTPQPAVSGEWRKMAVLKNTYFNFPRVFAIGTKAMFLSGNTIYEYDLSVNKIVKKADFPGAKRNFQTTAFSIGNKGYYGLGYNLETGSSESRNDLWEYEPSTEKWTRKADCPLPSFSGAFGIAINGKGYIGSGQTSGGVRLSDLYEYDPALDRWTKKGNFIGGSRYIYIAFSVGNYGYLGCEPDGSFFGGLWRYEPLTHSFEKKGNAPLALPLASFSAADKGFIYADAPDQGKGNDFFEYNAGTDKWTKKKDFGVDGKQTSLGFILNNKPYILINKDTQATLEIWEYTP